ncbi:MAG: hypothetical protein R3F11_15160 [Verrucomicrobiales bacterium]
MPEYLYQNLADPDQPVFVLGALVVPEASWLLIERDLESAIRQFWSAESSGRGRDSWGRPPAGKGGV